MRARKNLLCYYTLNDNGLFRAATGGEICLSVASFLFPTPVGTCHVANCDVVFRFPPQITAWPYFFYIFRLLCVKTFPTEPKCIRVCV